jgi:putative glutamine amidotransferase
MTGLRYPRGPMAGVGLDPATAPVIGLSAYAVPASWGIWSGETVLLPRAYLDAVLGAGGIPVLLAPLPGVIQAVLPRLDGLLIAGGPDVDPARYGQPRGPHTQPPVPDRDEAESALISAAIGAGLPVLGVCRGLQVLNVLRGGTLTQHLPDLVGHQQHSPPGGDTFARHPVRVAEGSRLAAALGLSGGRFDLDGVPTYHHQGLAEVGTGLVPTAWADDGTVEAVEDPSLPFCIGIQWHPEAGDDPALFAALVTAARQRAQDRA